jgi:hypothetical protein
MNDEPWAGWHVGWLHIDGAWQRQCWTADQDEALHILRVLAVRLHLVDATAAIRSPGRNSCWPATTSW